MIPDIAGLGVLLAGGSYVAYHLFRAERDAAARIDEAWDLAARRLHGNATESRRRYGLRELRCAVEGKTVLVQSETRPGRSGETMTKLRAGPLFHLAELELVVAPRGFLGKLAERLHLPETKIDDPEIHGAFRVVGKPAALVRALFDRRLAAAVLEVAEPFAIEKRELVIEREGYPEDPDALEAMVGYAGAIVRRWQVLEAAPLRLAKALDLELAAPHVDLDGDADAVVASGFRRGHELTMSVRLGEELSTRFAFAGTELAFRGIELDETEVAAELDARLAAAGRRGTYR